MSGPQGHPDSSSANISSVPGHNCWTLYHKKLKQKVHARFWEFSLPDHHCRTSARRPCRRSCPKCTQTRAKTRRGIPGRARTLAAAPPADLDLANRADSVAQLRENDLPPPQELRPLVPCALIIPPSFVFIIRARQRPASLSLSFRFAASVRSVCLPIISVVCAVH